jgi:hypothetical protein
VTHSNGQNATLDWTAQDAGLACEVAILWGTTVLRVFHLTPPCYFSVGEGESENAPCEFLIPETAIGTKRLPVVVKFGSLVAVALPHNATGSVTLPGQSKISLSEARQMVEPNATVNRERLLLLPLGVKVRLEIGEFTIQIAMICAGTPMRHGIQATDLSMLGYLGLSFAAVTSLLAVMMVFTPPVGLTSYEGMEADPIYLVQQYLNAATEREREMNRTEQLAVEKEETREGGTGTQTTTEEGSMGVRVTRVTNRNYAVGRSVVNPDPHLARATALRNAREFGMIGLLNTTIQGDPQTPTTTPWAQDTSAGIDELSIRGNLWGNELGDTRGASGLGLSGIGEGGGGHGEGIGLGSIGVLGHGSGNGNGQGFGSGDGSACGCGGDGQSQNFGAGHGRLGGAHRALAPQVRLGKSEVMGHLPPEVLQRVVRQNFGPLRQCYEQGLIKSPTLAGRVSVRFVIGRDGSVANVKNGGSDLPDRAVVNCVFRVYYGLSFPEPEGGIVTVTYPIQFAPQ